MHRSVRTLAWSLIAILGGAPAFAAAAAANDPPVDMWVEWRLELDAHGSIVDLDPIGREVPRPIRMQVASMARRWHYTPGTINGQPAPTTTALLVHIALDRVSRMEYRVRLLSTETGGVYGHIVKPSYPKALWRAGRQGKVWLHVDYDADGSVVAITPMEGRLPGDKDLTALAVAAVKHWTFEPETVAGHGVKGASIVPICFSIGRDDRPCRENPLADPRSADAATRDDVPVPLDSVVRVSTG